jgi:hypothetical protein
MRAPSFFSDPHVQFLSQLLEEIRGGLLQVPRFQRPLVWDWDRRRELLRSIRDGIPMGAIMVWRATTATIESYRHLGPFILAAPDPNSPKTYILDGVQRLSTLYGALNFSPKSDEALIDEDESDYDGEEAAPISDFQVFVDLEKQDFVLKDTDQDPSVLMPLNIVFDSVALLRFQRGLLRNDLEALVPVSDDFARAFRDYKVPLIPITTDDIDMATRTFQRINSQGARMSEAHMVHALTWSRDFDLRREMSNLRKDRLAKFGWGEIDDDPLLKACKAAFGLDVYKTNAEELSKDLRRRPSVLQDVGSAIEAAAEFLWTTCGVPTPDLVPYSLQIVVLVEAFRTRLKPPASVRHLLFAWFWVTTYGELFAGMTGDQVQIALSDIREIVNNGEPKWTWHRPFVERPLAPRFDFRAARAKALAFRLADAQNSFDDNRSGSKILADSGRKSVGQLLPWSRSFRESYSSPANRFLVHPTEAGMLRDALLEGELREADLKRHLIPSSAIEALSKNDAHGFVLARLRELNRYEANFLRPLSELFTEGMEKVGSKLL